MDNLSDSAAWKRNGSASSNILNLASNFRKKHLLFVLRWDPRCIFSSALRASEKIHLGSHLRTKRQVFLSSVSLRDSQFFIQNIFPFAVPPIICLTSCTPPPTKKNNNTQPKQTTKITLCRCWNVSFLTKKDQCQPRDISGFGVIWKTDVLQGQSSKWVKSESESIWQTENNTHTVRPLHSCLLFFFLEKMCQVSCLKLKVLPWKQSDVSLAFSFVKFLILICFMSHCWMNDGKKCRVLLLFSIK